MWKEDRIVLHRSRSGYRISLYLVGDPISDCSRSSLNPREVINEVFYLAESSEEESGDEEHNADSDVSTIVLYQRTTTPSIAGQLQLF